MRQKGEKGGNQDRDDCCDNVAHQKSHQPIVRDGKVGVSRLPEEDHHQCNDAACDRSEFLKALSLWAAAAATAALHGAL